MVVTENLLTGQGEHAAFAVREHAPVRPWPGWHTVHGVHDEAPAADHETPLTQLVHTALVVAVHVADRYLPGTQVLEAQAEQGA